MAQPVRMEDAAARPLAAISTTTSGDRLGSVIISTRDKIWPVLRGQGQGVLNVAAEHQPGASRRDIRKQAWTLIGTVAETLASVREHVTDDGVVFEVVTGVPAGGYFATHGHTLRLTVHPPPARATPASDSRGPAEVAVSYLPPPSSREPRRSRLRS